MRGGARSSGGLPGVGGEELVDGREVVGEHGHVPDPGLQLHALDDPPAHAHGVHLRLPGRRVEGGVRREDDEVPAVPAPGRLRQRREGGNEFFQAGIEDLGDRDMARADARSIADAHALLALTLPGRTWVEDVEDAGFADLGALVEPTGGRIQDGWFTGGDRPGLGFAFRTPGEAA